ncbi:hypothetical protein [Enterococcus sp. AZ103]|uniref:hypothetical protein n=1 Tax=Enterococcus sp. AZ103 TaxID=2774628 RepID=UPI003F1F4215
MKRIFMFRRIGLLLFMLVIGALLTGNVPTWLKIVSSILAFGHQLIYTEISYEVKRKYYHEQNICT